MKYEHQKGICAFENCLQTCINLGHSLSEMNFERIGITKDTLELVKKGEKYLTEEQFYDFIEILRMPIINTKLINWLYTADHWALVGIIEPLFSLKRHVNGEIIENIKAILDFPYIIINNPELQIEEGDSLSHKCPHGGIEELFVSEIDYSPHSNGRKPIYTLTVTRSKLNMHNTNNFNIGGNLQMSGNAHLNAGNVTDNSSNSSQELPTDFFNQARKLLEHIDETHRMEILDVVNKIEVSKNNKECGILFGKLFSLSVIADCITVFQPILIGLFKYLMP